VYDVLYFDQASRCSIVAAGLSRASAAEVARSEARQRKVGRMFLPGSVTVPRTHQVLIIRSGP
jgi:hypothetical protein